MGDTQPARQPCTITIVRGSSFQEADIETGASIHADCEYRAGTTGQPQDGIFGRAERMLTVAQRSVAPTVSAVVSCRLHMATSPYSNNDVRLLQAALASKMPTRDTLSRLAGRLTLLARALCAPFALR
jgi:hypothetical protein